MNENLALYALLAKLLWREISLSDADKFVEAVA